MTDVPAIPEFRTMPPKLAEAFVKAQAAMEAAEKASFNEQFKSATKPKGSTYSDLAAVVAAVHGPFGANGLAFMQLISSDAESVTCITRLLHASGEFHDSPPLKMPVVQKTPQGFGSAITYVKRYSLQAAAGLASEDDDGNAASSSPTPPTPKGTAQVKAAASGNANAAAIKKMCADAGLTPDEASAFVNGLLQGKKQAEVSAADVEAVKTALAERKK